MATKPGSNMEEFLHHLKQLETAYATVWEELVRKQVGDSDKADSVCQLEDELENANKKIEMLSSDLEKTKSLVDNLVADLTDAEAKNALLTAKLEGTEVDDTSGDGASSDGKGNDERVAATSSVGRETAYPQLTPLDQEKLKSENAFLKEKVMALERDIHTIVAKEKQEMALDILTSQGNADSIVKVLRTHVHASELPHNAVLTLWIPAILQGMGHYETSAKVQKESCSALADILVSSDTPQHCHELQEAIRELGGIRRIANSMKQFVYEAPVQTSACQALFLLSTTNGVNRDAILLAGGLNAIVKALQNHVRKPALVEEACAAVASLSFENTNNKNAFRESGGIPAIVAGMGEFKDSASVQEQGCLALGKLCFANTPNQDAVRLAGGIPTITFAMKNHVDVSAVQRQACGTLKNLSHENENNKESIREAGGIEAIVAAMAKHPEKCTVQKNACGALKNLVSTMANLQKLQELNGTLVLAEAVKRFPDECGPLVSSVLASF